MENFYEVIEKVIFYILIIIVSLSDALLSFLGPSKSVNQKTKTVDGVRQEIIITLNLTLSQCTISAGGRDTASGLAAGW